MLLPNLVLQFVLFVNAIGHGYSAMMVKRLNAYSRDLRLLIREPPLKVTKREWNESSIEELWMEQWLDHFEAAENNSTWFMRYLCNRQYFAPHGPIFIFVGGEWEISSAYLLSGLMHDMAKQHSGMLLYVEHRYYGQSSPVDNTLKYLNAHQTLADLAHFIEQLKATNAQLANSSVLLVGASYAGSLVAWFATLYPQLLSAGWASSAPLVAKMDFYEYMQHVSAVLKQKGGAACHRRLQQGSWQLDDMLHNTSTANALLERLPICDNFAPTNAMDRAALFNGIGNYFAALVQSYSAQIADVCERLLSLHTDDGEALLRYVWQVFWPSASTTRHKRYDWCIDLTYDGMKTLFSDQLTGARPWLYQSCHEFGWFATTTTQRAPPSQVDAFGQLVPLRYFQQLCRDVFGHASYTAHSMALSAAQTNRNFGALAHVSPRVIFTHGQLDPWRAVGLQNGPNVINIADHSHSADLGSIDLDDTVELNVAKLKVAAFLRRALRNNQ